MKRKQRLQRPLFPQQAVLSGAKLLWLKSDPAGMGIVNNPGADALLRPADRDGWRL